MTDQEHEELNTRLGVILNRAALICNLWQHDDSHIAEIRTFCDHQLDDLERFSSRIKELDPK